MINTAWVVCSVEIVLSVFCLSSVSLAGILFIFLIFCQYIVNLLLARSCVFCCQITGGKIKTPLINFALGQNIWTEYLHHVTSVFRFRNILRIHRSNIQKYIMNIILVWPYMNHVIIYSTHTKTMIQMMFRGRHSPLMIIILVCL